MFTTGVLCTVCGAQVYFNFQMLTRKQKNLECKYYINYSNTRLQQYIWPISGKHQVRRDEEKCHGGRFGQQDVLSTSANGMYMLCISGEHQVRRDEKKNHGGWFG